MKSDELPADCARRYRAIARIAAGGFGTVWRAEHRELGRQAAVKVLHDATAAEQVARFDREARVTAALAHPGIVVVYDHGAETGVPWIAYEFLSGRPLDALAAAGPQPPELVARVGTEVAAALAHAHASNVLHRDIKPGNVLEDGQGHYKIADFGIARWSGASEVRTATGIILGTPHYLAPEVIIGSEPTAAADVYALGAMLYELLAGAVPFDDENLAQLLGKHLHETPEPLLERVPGCPARLAEQVMQTLAKNPLRRPPAGELSEALARLAGSASGDSAAPAIRPSRAGLTRSLSRSSEMSGAPNKPTGVVSRPTGAISRSTGALDQPAGGAPSRPSGALRRSTGAGAATGSSSGALAGRGIAPDQPHAPANSNLWRAGVAGLALVLVLVAAVWRWRSGPGDAAPRASAATPGPLPAANPRDEIARAVENPTPAAIRRVIGAYQAADPPTRDGLWSWQGDRPGLATLVAVAVSGADAQGVEALAEGLGEPAMSATGPLLSRAARLAVSIARESDRRPGLPPPASAVILLFVELRYALLSTDPVTRAQVIDLVACVFEKRVPALDGFPPPPAWKRLARVLYLRALRELQTSARPDPGPLARVVAQVAAHPRRPPRAGPASEAPAWTGAEMDPALHALLTDPSEVQVQDSVLGMCRSAETQAPIVGDSPALDVLAFKQIAACGRLEAEPAREMGRKMEAWIVGLHGRWKDWGGYWLARAHVCRALDTVDRDRRHAFLDWVLLSIEIVLDRGTLDQRARLPGQIDAGGVNLLTTACTEFAENWDEMYATTKDEEEAQIQTKSFRDWSRTPSRTLRAAVGACLIDATWRQVPLRLGQPDRATEVASLDRFNVALELRYMSRIAYSGYLDRARMVQLIEDAKALKKAQPDADLRYADNAIENLTKAIKNRDDKQPPDRGPPRGP